LTDAGARCVFDPDAWLKHLRAQGGGERDERHWGNVGPEGNWDVLAGFFYYALMHNPIHEVFARMVLHSFVGCGLGNISHRRMIGFKVVWNVMIATTTRFMQMVSWPSFLIDPNHANMCVRHFKRADIRRRSCMLIDRSVRKVLDEILD